MTNQIIIRDADENDIADLASLMNELGYPTTMSEMEIRFINIRNHSDYRTFLAVYNDSAAGMIGLIRNFFYEKNGIYVRIGALIVSQPYRKMGIGKKLTEKAEDWALELGTDTIVLNSGYREERKGAHSFYLKLGFEQKSLGFVKKIIR